MNAIDSIGGRSSAALVRGLIADRNRPDLESLGRERDPERFVWRILPHAARSFAASIVVLPRDQARAAAVAYLYCRMLDTYEDLFPEPGDRIAELDRFGSRLEADPPPPPTEISGDLARTDRDRVHLLLVSRCNLVDAVLRTLPRDVRAQIAALVRTMADGMIWSTGAFAAQGGVLLDEFQLARYCRNVIGHPAVFVLDLVSPRELPDGAREDAYLTSEMIQLANVTRDIEADLARGVAYHPALRPHLGCSGYSTGQREVVRDVREELLNRALSLAGAYRRLFEGLGLGRNPGVRLAAVLMFRFTDLHYRGCAHRTGRAAWPGPRSRTDVVARSLPSLVSPRWAARTVRGLERDFLTAAAA